MNRIAAAQLILLLVSVFGCKSSTDDADQGDTETNVTDDTSSGEDTAGDDDDDFDIDTEGKLVHYGCVEKSGEACLAIKDQKECETQQYCQWGVGQCLPNGFGCRDEKTEEGCDSKGYCTYKTWETGEPCLFICDLHWDKDSCESADGCKWYGRFCAPTKLEECKQQKDEKSCTDVDDCAYVDTCLLAEICPILSKEEDCAKQADCTWKDGQCLFNCQLENATEEECEAANGDDDDDSDQDTDSDSESDSADDEEQLKCMWNDQFKICMNEFSMTDLFDCYNTENDKCAEKEKCHVYQECDLAVDCNELSKEECVKPENENFCTAGLCEHACTPKKSPQGCTANEECMWIPVLYETGQTCITACH